MQIKLLGWIGILFLGAIIVGVLWYFLAAPKTTPQTTQQSPVTLPLSGSVIPLTGSSIPSQTAQKLSKAVQDSGVVVTNDFIRNNATLTDASNVGNYYLTGSSTNGYAIGYRMPAQFFTIALEREPLGETRAAAENFLLLTLGISEEQLCSLNYYVGTDVYTSILYAGKNLGFSFCPGATVLPQ